jgi:hypothetical protein
MARFLRLINFFVFLSFIYGIEESVLEKDLYKVLGLDPKSSQQDIKKAFRKLAKVHHPDKSSEQNKEINEAIFREIAEAYEILSDPAQKHEYDHFRATYDERSRGGRNRFHDPYEADHGDMGRGRRDRDGYSRYGDAYPRGGGPQYDEYDASGFNEFADEIFGAAGMFQPVISGPILPAGQVIFPYIPIMSSSDGSHFALLDVHCSLGVYKGDVRLLVSTLMMGGIPDISALPIEAVYRTEGNSALQGHCFAGLDDSGVLRVYQ